MTHDEKDLLLKDLCARLPYGVKAYVKNWSKLERKWFEGTDTVKSIYPSLNTIFTTSELGSIEVILGHDDYEIKPYLFPMSKAIEEIVTTSNKHLAVNVDFFHKNHIDYRGLIEKGLAIDATNLNIY